MGPFGGERALTSSSCFDFGWKYGILRFPLVKLTIPVGDDTTFGFKNDAIWWKIWYQLTSCREPSLCIAFGPALKTFCFLHSGAQGWHFAVRHSLSSSKLCDVCCPSLFMHLPSPSRGRFWLKFDKSLFPMGKRTIRASSTRIKLHLEGFKLALWGTPVAHQIIAGNSISVTYGCHGHASVMACFHYWFQCPCLVRFMEFIVFPKEN